MKIIGVTGPSGSGKTVFTDYCRSVGIAAIDADRVYHEMLTPPSKCLDAIRDAFGDKVFNEDGSLNRTALSDIVFTDKQKLKLLNDTVLGMVVVKIQNIIKELEIKGHTAVIVDAPTLIESGFNKKCDIIIAVTAPIDLRIERLIKRDNKSKASILERLAAQLPDEFLISNSDYILENKGDIKSLSDEIDKLVKIILK